MRLLVSGGNEYGQLGVRCDVSKKSDQFTECAAARGMDVTVSLSLSLFLFVVSFFGGALMQWRWRHGCGLEASSLSFFVASLSLSLELILFLHLSLSRSLLHTHISLSLSLFLCFCVCVFPVHEEGAGWGRDGLQLQCPERPDGAPGQGDANTQHRACSGGERAGPAAETHGEADCAL